MKRMWLVMGLLVLTAGMSPVFAAPKKWDSKTPKEQIVTLSYASDVRIESIDGVEKNLGPLGILVFQGAGTDKKPKPSLIIPAGESTLGVSYEFVTGWCPPQQIKFNFIAGNTYQVKMGVDDAKIEEYTKANGAGEALKLIYSGKAPLKLEIIDITKKK